MRSPTSRWKFVPGLEELERRYAPATFIVNSLGDAPDDVPGDGVASTGVITPFGPEVTLRAALMEANAFAGADTIDFLRPLGGPITLNSALPPVRDVIQILGAGVEVRAAQGVAADGLVFLPGSGGSSVTGLTLRGFVDALRIQTDRIRLLGNTFSDNSGHGVRIEAGNNSLIGGAAVDANLITRNGGAGVAIQGGQGNTILSNIIFANGGLAIDLQPGGTIGPTPNDGDDGDDGPNNLQNFPDLALTQGAGGTFQLDFKYQGAAGRQLLLQFFGNTAARGEGEVPIGQLVVQTNPGGAASGSIVPPRGAFQAFSATATDLATGSTSEFAPPALVPAPPPPPAGAAPGGTVLVAVLPPPAPVFPPVVPPAPPVIAVPTSIALTSTLPGPLPPPPEPSLPRPLPDRFDDPGPLPSPRQSEQTGSFGEGGTETSDTGEPTAQEYLQASRPATLGAADTLLGSPAALGGSLGRGARSPIDSGADTVLPFDRASRRVIFSEFNETDDHVLHFEALLNAPAIERVPSPSRPTSPAVEPPPPAEGTTGALPVPGWLALLAALCPFLRIARSTPRKWEQQP